MSSPRTLQDQLRRHSDQIAAKRVFGPHTMQEVEFIARQARLSLTSSDEVIDEQAKTLAVNLLDKAISESKQYHLLQLENDAYHIMGVIATAESALGIVLQTYST